ncbi:hypothetical protein [Streptomyces swartbergensis]|nr:hypothetical protein [Streptomyces swartbergensis]
MAQRPTRVVVAPATRGSPAAGAASGPPAPRSRRSGPAGGRRGGHQGLPGGRRGKRPAGPEVEEVGHLAGPHRDQVSADDGRVVVLWASARLGSPSTDSRPEAAATPGSRAARSA